MDMNSQSEPGKGKIAKLAQIAPFLAGVALIGSGAYYYTLPEAQNTPAAVIAAKAPAIDIVGGQAPSISLLPIEGFDSFSNEDLRSGTPSLIVFFSSWNFSTRSDMAALNGVYLDGVNIMGVSFKENPESVTTFFDEMNTFWKSEAFPYEIPFDKVGSDLFGQMYQDWGLNSAADAFLIDGDGNVVLQVTGLNAFVLQEKVIPALEALR